MVRSFVIMLILVVVGTGAFLGWQSQHRTEAEALIGQAHDVVDSAIAAVHPSDK